jgi:hypothetical protein
MRNKKRTCGESNVLAGPFGTGATYFLPVHGSTLGNTPTQQIIEPFSLKIDHDANSRNFSQLSHALPTVVSSHQGY